MIDHEKWWNRDRFKHTTRPYSDSDVDSLRGSVYIEHTLAKLGAEKLWDKLHRKTIRALGALTGNQAMQQAKAGLEAVLQGIKGQYLYFEEGRVLNIRKHTGYVANNGSDDDRSWG